MSNGYKTIKLKKKRHIAWLTLNRPHKLNAINSFMLLELSETLDNIEKDGDIRCIIITGDGEKAFSTGADLTEIRKLTQETATEFSGKGQQVFSKLEKISKPIVAAISGYALGGGFELALACDFRIASECAELGCPEIRLGYIPAWGGTQRLPRIVGTTKAKRLIMLGERIQAFEALKMGLVDKVVPLEKLETEAEALAKRLCEYSPAALKYAKRAVYSENRSLFESGLKREREFFALLFSTKSIITKIQDLGSQRKKKEGDC